MRRPSLELACLPAKTAAPSYGFEQDGVKIFVPERLVQTPLFLGSVHTGNDRLRQLFLYPLRLLTGGTGQRDEVGFRLPLGVANRDEGEKGAWRNSGERNNFCNLGHL